MKIDIDFSLLPSPNIMGELLRSQLFEYSLCSSSSIEEKYMGGDSYKPITNGTIFDKVSDLIIDTRNSFDEDRYGYEYQELRTRLRVYSDGQIHVGWVQIGIDNINIIGFIVGDESVRTEMEHDFDNHQFDNHVVPFIWQ